MTPDREQELLAEIGRLKAENELLRRRLDLVLRKVFGARSEALDPSQLELLLDPDAAKKATAAVPADPGPAADTIPSRRTPRQPRDISRLEVRETVQLADEVRARPEGFREIGRVTTDRLDYQPAVIFINRLTRPVHVPLGDPDGVPVKAPAPPSPRPGLSATPALLAHVLAAKYRDHLPYYRQEGIYQQCHGVRLPRHTLCRWEEICADVLEPLYKLIHRGLLGGTYLQGDETPVRHLDPGNGRNQCSIGYLWVLHSPRDGLKGDILFQWHPNRRASCLQSLLHGFRGTLQTDAYAAYDSWASREDGITLAACWAHARRKFHEALQTGQKQAAGPLAAIQRLYHIETGLRESRATPGERANIRQARAAPVLSELKTGLIVLRQHPGVLPKSPLGKAIDYTLNLWRRLCVYAGDGHVEIDNNWIENGIRPTAIGKKNWLFTGNGGTGQRGAIIYTMVENCRRHKIDPEVWLADILTRLPSMTTRDDPGTLLPSRWQPPASEPRHQGVPADCYHR